MEFDNLTKQESRAILYLECASLVRKFIDLDKGRTKEYYSKSKQAYKYLRDIEREILCYLDLDSNTSITECFVSSFLFSTLINAGDCSNFFTYLTQALTNDVLARPLEWSIYIDAAKFFVEDSK